MPSFALLYLRHRSTSVRRRANSSCSGTAPSCMGRPSDVQRDAVCWSPALTFVAAAAGEGREAPDVVKELVLQSGDQVRGRLEEVFAAHEDRQPPRSAHGHVQAPVVRQEVHLRAEFVVVEAVGGHDDFALAALCHIHSADANPGRLVLADDTSVALGLHFAVSELAEPLRDRHDLSAVRHHHEELGRRPGPGGGIGALSELLGQGVRERGGERANHARFFLQTVGIG
mmetsp:Transcript_100707/g.323365  ORF Transcript_100707/g.323365 Transcript_100707/m.323365 type:complete len:228 (-) Transcript_100707:3408-4091(-)